MANNYVNLPLVGDGHWREPVVLTSQLPLSGNQIGDVKLAEDTNTIYVWTGSAWLAVATPGAAIALDGLLGDVTATGPGVVSATVNSVGGKTAASIAQSVTDTQAATSANTASTIVKRDASGNFSATTITANLTGNASGSAASFTGSLVGNVTGTQGATVVSTVGGQTAANVATATSLVNTAQSGNKVLASPNDGSSGAPAFRVLVYADLPALTTSTINSNTSAVLGTVYFADTSGGAFNLTLPTPVNGKMVLIKDKTGSFQTNNLTVVRNGSEKIEGLAASKLLQTNWGAWSLISDGTDWYMGPF